MKVFDSVRALVSDQFHTGELLGNGAQGEVYEIIDESDRVFKLSALYDVDPVRHIDDVFSSIHEIYSLLMQQDISPVVCVYEFGLLRSDERSTVNGPQAYKIYYSVQERLYPLSEDEKRVFKTVCQHFNGDITLQKSLQQTLEEMTGWFDFNVQKVLTFCKEWQECCIDNYDFHRRNIMKTETGRYKIIDLDLAELKG